MKKPFRFNDEDAAERARQEYLLMRARRPNGRRTAVTMLQMMRMIADAEEAGRRLEICRFMDAHNIPNTPAAHEAACHRLWSPRTFRELGVPPTGRTLVRWRSAIRPRKQEPTRRDLVQRHVSLVEAMLDVDGGAG